MKKCIMLFLCISVPHCMVQASSQFGAFLTIVALAASSQLSCATNRQLHPNQRLTQANNRTRQPHKLPKKSRNH